MRISELVGIKQDSNAKPYNVVEKTISGPSAGVVTWTTYASKEAYDARRAGKMQDGSGRLISQVYATVAEGVSEIDAKKLCDNANSLDTYLEAALKETAEIADPALREIFFEMKARTAVMASIKRIPNQN